VSGGDCEKGLMPDACAAGSEPIRPHSRKRCSAPIKKRAHVQETESRINKTWPSQTEFA
jgi:hypothetical protein